METRSCNRNAGILSATFLALSLSSGIAIAGGPVPAAGAAGPTPAVSPASLSAGQVQQADTQPLRLALLDADSPAVAPDGVATTAGAPEGPSVPPALWVAAIAVLGLVSVGRRHSGDS